MTMIHGVRPEPHAQEHAESVGASEARPGSTSLPRHIPQSGDVVTYAPERALQTTLEPRPHPELTPSVEAKLFAAIREQPGAGRDRLSAKSGISLHAVQRFLEHHDLTTKVKRTVYALANGWKAPETERPLPVEKQNLLIATIKKNPRVRRRDLESLAGRSPQEVTRFLRSRQLLGVARRFRLARAHGWVDQEKPALNAEQRDRLLKAIVKTPRASIRVLSRNFNVNAYNARVFAKSMQLSSVPEREQYARQRGWDESLVKDADLPLAAISEEDQRKVLSLIRANPRIGLDEIVPHCQAKRWRVVEFLRRHNLNTLTRRIAFAEAGSSVASSTDMRAASQSADGHSDIFSAFDTSQSALMQSMRSPSPPSPPSLAAASSKSAEQSSAPAEQHDLEFLPILASVARHLETDLAEVRSFLQHHPEYRSAQPADVELRLMA